jgi:uncharacterized protein YcbX
MHIHALWQFPMKGVGGSTVHQTHLAVDQPLAGDRRYALSAGSAKAAHAGDNQWLQKAHFLQLMTTESLAALCCRQDGDTVIIEQAGRPVFDGNLTEPDTRARCQSTIAGLLQLPDPSALRIHVIDNGAYTDQSAPLISIGGSASLAAFAAATNTTPDARRFRLNIMLATDTAFIENQWCGAKLHIGDAVIEIIDHVGRCAAINVDPATATRETDYLAIMRHSFGHSHLGVFGRVIKKGEICTGDSVSVIQPD